MALLFRNGASGWHIIQVYNYRYFQKRSIFFYLVEKNGNLTISFHSPGTWLSFIEDDLTIDQCVEGRNHALFRSNGYFTYTINNPPVLLAMILRNRHTGTPFCFTVAAISFNNNKYILCMPVSYFI